MGKKKNDNGRGFIGEGEPHRTLCTELVGNNTVIPKEAYAVHGEEVEELDMGFPFRDPRDPEYHHQELENLSEEDVYPDRYGSEEIANHEEREAKRCDLAAIAKAGVNLMLKLKIEPTKMNYDIVAIYLDKRTDGLIGRFFLNLKYNRSEEAGAIVEFFEKMKKFQPSISERATSVILAQARTEKREEEEEKLCEIRNNTEISQEVRRRLIAQAQSRHNNGNHLATRLGQILFGKDKFGRMLRAAV
jgi:hypothetical protein